MARSLWRNHQLIMLMARREVVGRYRGSLLGIAWSLFNPLLMLLVYTFVFSRVFHARWGMGEDEGHAGFAVVLFVGMIVHGLFAECINRAPQLIVGNVSYVKKVVFPLEILPWVAMSAALFHSAVSLFVLLLVQVSTSGWIPWTALLLPLIFLPLTLTTMGFAWFLAATGVYVKDIGHITGFVTALLLFASPVFYPVSAIPEPFRTVLLLNPLTFIIEQSRLVLIQGALPDWTGLGLYSLASFAVAWAGFGWFQKIRRGFADVL